MFRRDKTCVWLPGSYDSLFDSSKARNNSKPHVTKSSPLESRLIEVEMQLMHLQHEYDQLNAECLRQRTLIENQGKRLERLEKLLHQLLDRLDSAGSDSVH